MNAMELKKNFYWTGCLDPGLRVFDIVMNTEFGTTYNSYLIKGSEKTALFETAKAKCLDDYLQKVTDVVDIKDIDYLIVDHTEPDHAGSAVEIIRRNPAIKLVGSGMAIRFMKEITNMDFTSIVVKDGDTISLGDKTLHFISAVNLHWPDAMYTYIEEDKTLITCDSFGCHYSLEEMLISRLQDREGYDRALRYYFDNIMGPFKPYVLKAIDKIKDLDVDMICPGHGPVLDKDPWKVVEAYKEWATEVNPNEKKTVVMPYVSAYGYTKILADKISEGIRAAGDIDVKQFDMVEADHDAVMNEIYWTDGLLFGSPTIVGEALRPIWDLTTAMFGGVHGGKIASAFGSYGWSGEAVPHLMQRLGQLKLKIYGEGLKVHFKPSPAQLEEAYEFGYGFGQSVLAGKVVEPEPERAAKRYWKCLVCGEVVEGPKPPESCPVCGVGPDQFVEIFPDETGFTSDEKMKVVILGGGIAGLSAAEAIRKRSSAADIEIISDEEVFCYNRPMLTKGLLSQFDAINFFTHQMDWYEENKIKCTLGHAVKSIDLKGRKVVLDDGSERAYDKLIYALGAECNVPPIPGHEGSHVHVIRKLADANEIRDQLDSIKTVAVIGGGVLGLEAAWEFARAGKEVSVIELSDGVMAKQLDAKGSALLGEAAEKAGVRVITGAKIDGIVAGGVKLSAGTRKSAAGGPVAAEETVPGDIVVISAGVRPNTQVGFDAGLSGEKSGGRWIDVDEKMLTSDPDVYAAGDVAAFQGTCVAIWPQAQEMGKVAGMNAVGDQAAYKPVTPSNAFSGFGLDLFAIGDNGKNPDLHYKEVELSEPAKGIYKKLYFTNDRFSGGILIGAPEQGANMMKAFEQKMKMKDALAML
ncbi:MAG: FAD-dependent oxidoreductase [Anaerovoracaceae bacterium]|jgi:flavorubredoxin/NADPH-dependent 2,4-dienoyl-CoA reductase/sulfur reductase-like enzyme